MRTIAPIRENLHASVETQLLQDMHSIVRRISHLVSDPEAGTKAEKTFVELLELALTMESTFAVWCWCHVHLERNRFGSHAQMSLRSRAEAAVDDADRIAERLYEITGASFHLEWLPSVRGPLAAEGWTLDRSIRDHIAMTADCIALESYSKLIDYARRHHLAAGTICEDIAYSRKKRLGMGCLAAS
jgi:hypothetical protein